MTLSIKHAAIISAVLVASLSGSAQATPALPNIKITEVDPQGSSAYCADWFEVTNFGSVAADLTGWKMDDSSSAFATAVALSGVTSIDPGKTALFFETTNLLSIRTAFVNNWFAGTAPSGLQFGSYSGSGVGLNTSGDGVTLFNSSGTQMAKVTFGAMSDLTKNFDNAAGLDNTTISAASAVGVNGAFSGVDNRVGSPGVIAAPVPVPAAVLLLGSALGSLGFVRRRAG
jgi:hypothetical protein